MNRPRGRGYPPKRPSLNQMAHNARLVNVIRQHMAPKPVNGDIASLIHQFAQHGNQVLAQNAPLDGGAVSRPHGPMPVAPAQPYQPNAMPAPGRTPDSMNPRAQAYAKQMLARYGVYVNPGEDAALLWRNLSGAQSKQRAASAAELAAAHLRQLLAQNYDANPGAAVPAYSPGAAPGSAGVGMY